MWDNQSKKQTNEPQVLSTKVKFDQPILSRQWGRIYRNWQRYKIIGLDTRRDGQTFWHSNNGGAKNGIISTINKELARGAGLSATPIQRKD